MKRIFFLNDRYAKAPWYVRILVLLPFTLLFGSRLVENSFTESIAFRIFVIILVLAFYAFILFQGRCKNAFIYQNLDRFGIRLNGKRTDIDAKFISEVSLDKDHQLQIRRINRVDRFDLSPFREKDRLKLMRYLKEFISNDILVSDVPILETTA